jgi:hypothetical protein
MLVDRALEQGVTNNYIYWQGNTFFFVQDSPDGSFQTHHSGEMHRCFEEMSTPNGPFHKGADRLAARCRLLAYRGKLQTRIVKINPAAILTAELNTIFQFHQKLTV